MPPLNPDDWLSPSLLESLGQQSRGTSGQANQPERLDEGQLAALVLLESKSFGFAPVVVDGVVDEPDPRDEPEPPDGVVSIHADLPTGVADKLEALAVLSDRTPAEELNFAASFWLYVRQAVMDGGAVLLKERSGLMGPIDLAGLSSPASQKE